MNLVGTRVEDRTVTVATVMQEAEADVEAHLLPTSPLNNSTSGGFADHVLCHGVRLRTVAPEE